MEKKSKKQSTPVTNKWLGAYANDGPFNVTIPPPVALQHASIQDIINIVLPNENNSKSKPIKETKTPWSELTHMFTNQESIQEMEKKFKNSFLILETKTKKTIGRYIGWTGNSHKFVDKFNAILSIKHETSTKISIPIVRKGLYQCGDVMLFGKYTAYRQYRKSINSDSFITIDPMYQITFDNDLLMYNYLNQEYPHSLEVAIKLLIDNKKQSQVISREFGIGFHNEVGIEPIYLLFYQDVLIGQIDINTKKIKILNEFFNQEVMDANRTIDFSGYEVVYAQT